MACASDKPFTSNPCLSCHPSIHPSFLPSLSIRIVLALSVVVVVVVVVVLLLLVLVVLVVLVVLLFQITVLDKTIRKLQGELHSIQSLIRKEESSLAEEKRQKSELADTNFKENSTSLSTTVCGCFIDWLVGRDVAIKM